jgi:hypothetical protein
VIPSSAFANTGFGHDLIIPRGVTSIGSGAFINTKFDRLVIQGPGGGCDFETSGLWNPDPGQFVDTGLTYNGQPYYISETELEPGVSAYLYYDGSFAWRIQDVDPNLGSYITYSAYDGNFDIDPAGTWLISAGFSSTGSIVACGAPPPPASCDFETSGTWTPDPGQFTDTGLTVNGQPYYVSVDGFGPGVDAYLSFDNLWWIVSDVPGTSGSYWAVLPSGGPAGPAYQPFFGFTASADIVFCSGGSPITIDDNAFASCTDLQEIYLAVPPTSFIGTTAFSGLNNITFYVSESHLSSYQGLMPNYQGATNATAVLWKTEEDRLTLRDGTDHTTIKGI